MGQLNMSSEPWWNSDPKEGPRIRASRDEWRELQVLKAGPCRICGNGWKDGMAIGLHHLVARSLLGDDVPENLVPLCGSGTTGCHGKVEDRDPEACSTLRKNLTAEEIAYCLRKKGELWLDSRYPLVPFMPVESLPGALTETLHEGMEPGSTCPTCERRIPHPKKKTSPKSKVISYRVPEEVQVEYQEVLEAAATHAGTIGKPFWQWQTMNLALALLLQGPADPVNASEET